MNLDVDEKVIRWLLSKGEHVTVKTIHVSACCAPPIQELMTHLGKPRDIQNYQEFKVDNVSIFVEKHLLLKEKLSLKLTGTSIFKTITAKVQ